MSCLLYTSVKQELNGQHNDALIKRLDGILAELATGEGGNNLIRLDAVSYTHLHLEFESDSVTREDLRRFREYEAATSRTFQVAVITYVICSSNAVSYTHL